MADESAQAQEDEYTEEVEDGEELEEEEVEGEEAAAEGEEGEEHSEISLGALKDVNDKSFDEVRLPQDVVQEAQAAWSAFLGAATSREAAGEAIYAALFDSAPSLQSLFKTPRSVMAMRFMNGLNSIISVLQSPSQLKITVETLGFQHLDLEVTVPRVVIFRDAIIDLFDMEMGARFTSKAKAGFRAMLNYVGGAYIYIRREYAVRIRTIMTSWKTATNKVDDMLEDEFAPDAEGEGEGGEGEEGEEGEGGEKKEKQEDKDMRNTTSNANNVAMASGEGRASGEKGNGAMKVPTTFNEMFMFNSAVMGFGQSLWMNIVLEQFNDMVMNVANSYRLQEECDVLSLCLAKYKGPINLPEFKAVMLASLRSLVPKDWDTDHEVAWGWLWENVERMLQTLIGKPEVQEKALERLIMSFTEDAVNYLRREVYKRFFALAPAGQDYFKQSTTRLYWIADKIVEMTIEIYREPKKMVEDISALGLRHVGYAIPTEFFAPFVSGAVEVIRGMTTDDTAEDAFRWALTLISKILVRTIMEGSTIVMKAINTNSEQALRKAISVAARGRRSLELLNITVGTQSISPLYWAIESGSMNCGRAMIKDLLTIRADRDNYYYGFDDLFTRHPDVILRFTQDAEELLPSLFDGLIWRSRVATAGQRRVNYYVKHLIVDEEGKFNQALEWLVTCGDPKIICHPVIVLFSDILWAKISSAYFVLGRMWFLFTLCIFIVSQSVLPNMERIDNPERIATFGCRCFIYLGSLGQLGVNLVSEVLKDCKTRGFVRVYGVPVPQHFTNPKELLSLCLVLALIMMIVQEPIFHCSSNMFGDFEGSGWFTTMCPAADELKDLYSASSAVAMLMYWSLVTDLTILSTRISAFALVCFRVVSEVGLFLGALVGLCVAFACSITTLTVTSSDFHSLPKSMLSLAMIALGMYPTSHFEEIRPLVFQMVAVSAFMIISMIFLLNLLIAQLNGAYQAIYADMVGFARLTRSKVTCEMITYASASRWQKFTDSLKLEERLEFNEGDVGVAGGIQVLEPANANPTTVDMIKRFGGSTSPAMQWPEEEGANDDDENKFDRLEKLIVRATKNMGGSTSGGKSKGSSSGGASGSGSGSHHSGSEGGGEE